MQAVLSFCRSFLSSFPIFFLSQYLSFILSSFSFFSFCFLFIISGKCFIYCSKTIEIGIIDDEDYEKKETFYVVLGEPQVIKELEEPPPPDEEFDAEKARIEELGKPRLGEFFFCNVNFQTL